jgi:hypothetical protein
VERGPKTRHGGVHLSSDVGHPLFNSDKAVAIDRLRELAREEVCRAPLIVNAAGGDRSAARALHIGFWPFVSEFEIAIDKRRLPRAPLRQRYPDRFAAVFPKMAAAVREMRREEGSHAAHWREDAKQLGIKTLEAPLMRFVQQLINSSYSENLPHFFCVLAGTEFIAEELAAFLLPWQSFTSLFQRKRWAWGEIHVLPHGHGPSHLEIDIDLARAYSPNGDVKPIEKMIADTIRLFGRAARQVEQRFAK